MPSLTAIPARPTRRSVALGAAWAVPTIAVGAAAPAMAASLPPCGIGAAVNYTMYYPSTVGTTMSATGDTFSPAGCPVDLSAFTNTKTGTVTRNTTYNLKTYETAGDFGQSSTPSLSTKWIELYQSGAASGAYQEVVYVFSQPIYNVSFQVGDIDSDYLGGTAGRYQDQVVVNPGATGGAAFTATPVDPSFLAGAGTNTVNSVQAATNAGGTTPAGGPWEQPLTSTRALVTFNAAGPLTSITIRYSNINPLSSCLVAGCGVQQVYLSPIKFNAVACA